MSEYKMGSPAKSGNKESETVAFSVRLSKELVDQIDARRKVAKRSRNMEVELLIERQIQVEVQRDLELVKKMAELNSPLQSNQS